MHLTVHQTINIHLLKIGNISNASIVQIGAAGSIQTTANLANSGQFEKLADPADVEGLLQTPIVPLVTPAR